MIWALFPRYSPDTKPVSSPKARAKFEEAWSASLPEEPGLTALEMLWAAEAGSLKGLIIVGENPVLSYPDSSRVIKALKEPGVSAGKRYLPNRDHGPC